MKHTKYLFIALIISVGLVSFQSTAQAISAAQFDCEYSCFQVPGDNIWHADPALSVTFKNPKLEKVEPIKKKSFKALSLSRKLAGETHRPAGLYLTSGFPLLLSTFPFSLNLFPICYHLCGKVF